MTYQQAGERKLQVVERAVGYKLFGWIFINQSFDHIECYTVLRTRLSPLLEDVQMNTGPAFPLGLPEGSVFLGITKLDYFAAASLQGFLARDTLALGHDPKVIADACYNLATAMIEESHKRNKS